MYYRYVEELLKFAVQKTNNQEDSKELVQNTFISLFNNKETANQIQSIPSFLYTVLKNRIFDQYRHELIRGKFQDHAVYTHQFKIKNDISDYIENKELALQLEKEVNNLPSQCRNVFKMRRELELSNKEIASNLQISENTVEQHMRKALRILKTAFGML